MIKSTFSKRRLLSFALFCMILIGLWHFRSSLVSGMTKLGDQQAMSSTIQELGYLGPVLLFCLLVAQVFLAVIPGHALMMAGGYVFGPSVAITITSTSTILGSQIAFWIARRYGRKLIYRLAKADAIERWNRIARRQGAWFFFFAFVLPIFPSDLMCYVAGLGKVSPRGFLAANIAGRLLCAITITLIGCYGLKPPWQIVVLIIIGLTILFSAWGLSTKKIALERIKNAIAHFLGMWILNTYQHIFSIQICAKGVENLHPGAKILAANHPNLSDTYLLPLLVDGKVRVLAKASQFHAPLLGWIFTHTGQIPVHDGRRQEAYQLACQALAAGDTLLIYPEGRLNPDNEKIKLCTGAVRMALSSGAPIIPAGIHVANRDTIRVSPAMYPVDSRKLWQVRGKFTIHFGEPWHPNKDPAKTQGAIEAHALTKLLMEKIDQLRKQAALESDL